MKKPIAAIVLLSLLAASCGPPAGKRVYECAALEVTVDFKGDAATLRAEGQTTEFKRVASEDGTKYEAVGEPSTTFVVDGDTAALTIGGISRGCVQQP